MTSSTETKMVLLVLVRGEFDLVSKARKDLLEEVKKFQAERPVQRSCGMMEYSGLKHYCS